MHPCHVLKETYFHFQVRLAGVLVVEPKKDICKGGLKTQESALNSEDSIQHSKLKDWSEDCYYTKVKLFHSFEKYSLEVLSFQSANDL